jgi:hypothetical protein
MTQFVHVDQPTVHPGVQRAEVLFERVQAARSNSTSSRPLLILLLVAIVAAVLVVTEKLVANWDEGALLAAWTVLCGAVFAVIALFAGSLRNAGSSLAANWRAGAERRSLAQADARFFESAKRDPRVMQDLQAALWRHQPDGIAAVAGSNIPARRTAAEVVQGSNLRNSLSFEGLRNMSGVRDY